MMLNSSGYFMSTAKKCARSELFGYYDELGREGATITNNDLFDVAVKRAVALCGEHYRDEIEEEVQELLPSQRYETLTNTLSVPDIPPSITPPKILVYDEKDEPMNTTDLETPGPVPIHLLDDDELSDLFDDEGMSTPPRLGCKV